MKAAALVAAVTLVVAITACNDAVTSPDLKTVSLGSLRLDEPPPPPIDSGMASMDVNADGSSTSFLIATNYFFNKTKNAGWLTFVNDPTKGITVTPQTRIKYVNGSYVGLGSITVTGGGNTFFFDLSKVDLTGTSFRSAEEGLYTLVISGGTLNGNPISKGGLVIRASLRGDDYCTELCFTDGVGGT